MGLNQKNLRKMTLTDKEKLEAIEEVIKPDFKSSFEMASRRTPYHQGRILHEIKKILED